MPHEPLTQPISEPRLTAEQRRDYEEGWQLFTSGHYWHAHEAWERLWRPFEGPARTFVQGLIQLTAACHLTQQPGRSAGAIKNLDKSEDKLRHFVDVHDAVQAGRFLDVDVRTMLALLAAIRDAVRKGEACEEELTRLAKTVALTPIGDAEDQSQK